MHHSCSLNDLYEQYTAGSLEKKDFEGAIFKKIQDNVRRFGLLGLNREDGDDFISWLYLRISRAINAYQDTGSSFETYIGNLVHLSAKEYRSRQIRGFFQEASAWIAHIPDMYACEHEAEYHEYGTEDPQNRFKLKNPRQLLILILKCSGHISPDFLEKIAPQLGMDSQTLFQMTGRLKEQREKRERDLLLMRERVNRQFYRCILFEKKLQSAEAGSIISQRLEKKLEQGRERLFKTRNRLIRTRLDPSNRQIAQLLGVSKGTVDSVLYNLKTRYTLPDEDKACPAGHFAKADHVLSSKKRWTAREEKPSLFKV
jgi:DNA-directed RNA polymerase specialized sigma24 family protein